MKIKAIARVTTPAKPKDPQAQCWQCRTHLPEGIVFFCNEQCGYTWAMNQAYTLNRVVNVAR